MRRCGTWQGITIACTPRLAWRDFSLQRGLRRNGNRPFVSCFNDNAAGLLLYARLGYRLSGLVERQRGQQRVALVQFVKPVQN
jgi:hypothetical protein